MQQRCQARPVPLRVQPLHAVTRRPRLLHHRTATRPRQPARATSSRCWRGWTTATRLHPHPHLLHHLQHPHRRPSPHRQQQRPHQRQHHRRRPSLTRLRLPLHQARAHTRRKTFLRPLQRASRSRSHNRDRHTDRVGRAGAVQHARHHQRALPQCMHLSHRCRQHSPLRGARRSLTTTLRRPRLQQAPHRHHHRQQHAARSGTMTFVLQRPHRPQLQVTRSSACSRPRSCQPSRHHHNRRAAHTPRTRPRHPAGPPARPSPPSPHVPQHARTTSSLHGRSEYVCMCVFFLSLFDAGTLETELPSFAMTTTCSHAHTNTTFIRHVLDLNIRITIGNSVCILTVVFVHCTFFFPRVFFFLCLLVRFLLFLFSKF